MGVSTISVLGAADADTVLTMLTWRAEDWMTGYLDDWIVGQVAKNRKSGVCKVLSRFA